MRSSPIKNFRRRVLLSSVLVAALASSSACSSSAPAPPSATGLPRVAPTVSAAPTTDAARKESPGDEPPADKMAVHGADWCIHGGSALVGSPVVDDQGRVYLVTADGYLHAFEADGRYRFSYTVKGTPLGSISLRPSDGAILLGTTAQRVYAINQSGRLLWSFSTITPVWSGIHPLDARTVVFIGLDFRLYALSTTGAARYRVPVPGIPVGEPTIDASGTVWVPLDTGIAGIEQAHRVERIPFEAPVERIVPLGGDRLVALSGGRVWTVADDRSPRDRGTADYVSAVGEVWLAASEEGDALLFDGQKRSSVSVPAGLSDNPVLTDGTAYFPLADGSLAVFDGWKKEARAREAGALRVRRLPVADEALRTPVRDPSSGRLVVPTASGRICSLMIPPAPPGARPFSDKAPPPG